ncbi:MAG: hypothetical protein SW833_01475 [Cyanobacteriota bacterium]|nr:hypothetical protein [Cyanobacteriota bacterium]
MAEMQREDGENVAQKEYRRKQQWELVRGLLQRTDLNKRAKEAFGQAYPELPEKLLNAAIFHTYIEGIGAAID